MPGTAVRFSLIFALACTLGVVAWAADRVSFDSSMSIVAGAGNLPSHWLVTAFTVGVIARSRPAGPLAATLALCLAVVVYYAAISWAGDRPGVDLQRPALVWSAVALVAGPMFGLAGAVWLIGPSRLKPWAVALLSGGFFGEAFFILWRMQTLDLGEPAVLFASLEIILAMFLPVVMLRSLRDTAIALSFGALFGLVAWAAIEGVRRLVDDVLRPY